MNGGATDAKSISNALLGPTLAAKTTAFLGLVFGDPQQKDHRKRDQHRHPRQKACGGNHESVCEWFQSVVPNGIASDTSILPLGFPTWQLIDTSLLAACRYDLAQRSPLLVPRPKKDGISEEVGNIPVARKRGNPDFKVSSYYIPAGLNLKFDRAVLALKAAGYDIDRSDILAALISRFVHQVDVAEQAADAETGMNLEAILDASGEGSLGDTAEVSHLKNQLKEMIASVKKEQEMSSAHFVDARAAVAEAKEISEGVQKMAEEAEEDYRQKFDQKFDGLEAQMKAQEDLLQKLIDREG